MTPKPQRAEPLPPAQDAAAPANQPSSSVDFGKPAFDEEQWREQYAEEHGAVGRPGLATALMFLAGLWLGYTAWSAGRTLAGQPLSSPLIAQWVAIAAGPLALMGLVWLMFGRTRRKEAERFTRSIATMRSEVRSFEGLLQVLSERINDSRSELTMISQHLMRLGDDATGKLGRITREFDSCGEKLKLHGEALDRAAEAARNDIAILLDDLPRAEQNARAVAEQIRSVGSESAAKAEAFGQEVNKLTERTRSADELVADATGRLTTRLSEIESAGQAAATRVGEAERAHSGTLDTLLERTSATLDQIRSGIDVQAAAVASLVAQASAGIGKAGADAAESLAANLDHANRSLEGLSTRVAEQRERFTTLLASVDDGVEGAHSKLASLASTLAQVEREAAGLSNETGPALAASLVQVKEAAAHAADRAREAIMSVIPETAGKLSEQAAEALERVIRESIEDRLRDVENVAARAVDSARSASDRLTHQMITLGQTASALEAHIEQTSKEQREKDSEAFAKRVALLIDSMHSAAIDVGKIMADDIDDQAWNAYLKGNRGVFTSRAVRLISGGEAPALRAHYESDSEFQRSVNRYVADFESMLRRVLAERDGAMIAVTLLSSDMGKLYAALAQAIDKLR